MKFRKKSAVGNFLFEKIAPSSGENVQKFNIFATRGSKFLEIQKSKAKSIAAATHVVYIRM